jgi:hypothetical protein
VRPREEVLNWRKLVNSMVYYDITTGRSRGLTVAMGVAE